MFVGVYLKNKKWSIHLDFREHYPYPIIKNIVHPTSPLNQIIWEKDDHEEEDKPISRCDCTLLTMSKISKWSGAWGWCCFEPCTFCQEEIIQTHEHRVATTCLGLKAAHCPRVRRPFQSNTVSTAELAMTTPPVCTPGPVTLNKPTFLRFVTLGNKGLLLAMSQRGWAGIREPALCSYYFPPLARRRLVCPRSGKWLLKFEISAIMFDTNTGILSYFA